MAVALTCPTCSAALRMERPVQIGSSIRCPRCGNGFAFQPPKETAVSAAPSSPRPTAPLARIVAATPGQPPAPAAIPLALPSTNHCQPASAPLQTQLLAAVAAISQFLQSFPKPLLYGLVALGITVFLSFSVGGLFVLRAALSSRPVAGTSKPATTLAAASIPATPKKSTERPTAVALPANNELPAAVRRRQEWLQRTLLGDYDRLNRKKQPWNADAREVLRLTAEDWKDCYRSLSTMLASFRRAEQAGCKDPLVGYGMGRLCGSSFRHDLAALRMKNSSYHPAHRCLALIRGAPSIGGPGNLAVRLDALKLLAEAAADKDVPLVILLDICERLENSFLAVQKDRKFGFDKIEAELIKARPESSLLYTYRGKFYICYAWDARGDGYGNTVTPDGWRVFGERLALAETALKKAWQLDPTNTDAARAMLTVELGQGKGRQRMELWFQRAMSADPGNYNACHDKLYYLEPKWHGSAEEMLAFGRECLQAGAGKKNRVPLILAEAHEALAAYNQGNPDAYYTSSPAVWKDIQAAYEPYLKAYPKAAFERTRYAFFACRCEQWPVAYQQFSILGDDAQINVFGSQNRYDQLRRDAARFTKQPPLR